MKPRLHNIVGKSLVLLLICISFLTRSYSQAFLFGNENFKVETGINFGPSFFLGDLGGNRGKGTAFLKDLNLDLTKMMKGAFITVYPNSWLGFRLAADVTYLEGRDDIITTTGIDELWRKQRNLDFKTTILEGYGCVEVFPTMFFNRKSEFEPRLRPYGLVGIGIFHFDPKGSLTDANGNKTWYNLQPLRTEGEGMAEYPQSKPYNLTQMNIPLGVGIKYYASDRVNLSMEVLYRKTFTDYIDDVSKTYVDPKYFAKYLSPQNAAIAEKIYDKTIPIIFPGMTRWPEGTQRGDKTQDDAYFSIMARIGIRLGPIEASSFARRAVRQTRCPSVY
jgi:hypothetical protein